MPKQITMISTVAVCLAYTIALVPGNLSPLIVGGLIAGLGLGVADAGMILSIELLLMGITATGLATRISRIDARNACLAGAAILFLGHGFAATAGNLEEVIVWRSLAGVGAGVVLAAVNATIAGSSNPPRLYGLTLMAPPLIGAVVAFFMSRAIAAFAHAGAYGVLALLTLLVLPILVVFPDYRREAMSTQPEPLQNHGPGVALLLATFIMGTCMMAYFAFLERLGVRLDLSIERIGDIFTAVVVGGAIGAGIAGVLEKRIGLRLPLAGGVILHATAISVVVQVEVLPVYIAGALLEGITLVFLLTFLLTTAALLDPLGRWAAATGGAFSLSLGAGPYLGGVLIEAAGFEALTILNSAGAVVVIFLILWATKYVRADQ